MIIKVVKWRCIFIPKNSWERSLQSGFGYDELRAAGYEVVGVSKDGEASHRKFIEKQSLPFDLIADTDTSLNQAFGVWAEKKLYGRTYMGTLRTTFIINEEGIIERIIDKVDTKNHAAQILNDK